MPPSLPLPTLCWKTDRPPFSRGRLSVINSRGRASTHGGGEGGHGSVHTSVLISVAYRINAPIFPASLCSRCELNLFSCEGVGTLRREKDDEMAIFRALSHQGINYVERYSRAYIIYRNIITSRYLSFLKDRYTSRYVFED